MSRGESVAHDMIRAFVERIERMNEEKRSINDDIKEIYAEAKGNGFDTKALKIIIRKREQDHNELVELESIVELYEAALGMRAYPQDDEDEVGTARATPAGARATIATTRIQSNSGPDSLKTADLSATADPSHPATHGGPADGAEPDLAPVSSATQSTAALMEVPGSPPVIENPPVLGENGEGYSHKDSERPLDTEQGSIQSHAAGAPADTQARPVDTQQQVSRAPRTAADNARMIRPWCLHADDLPNCGGQGRKHCFTCLKAHADEVGEAA